MKALWSSQNWRWRVEPFDEEASVTLGKLFGLCCSRLLKSGAGLSSLSFSRSCSTLMMSGFLWSPTHRTGRLAGRHRIQQIREGLPCTWSYAKGWLHDLGNGSGPSLLELTVEWGDEPSSYNQTDIILSSRMIFKNVVVKKVLLGRNGIWLLIWRISRG